MPPVSFGGCLDQGAGKTAPTFTEIRSRNGYDPYKEGLLLGLNQLASRRVPTLSKIETWKTKNQIQAIFHWYEEGNDLRCSVVSLFSRCFSFSFCSGDLLSVAAL